MEEQFDSYVGGCGKPGGGKFLWKTVSGNLWHFHRVYTVCDQVISNFHGGLQHYKSSGCAPACYSGHFCHLQTVWTQFWSGQTSGSKLFYWMWWYSCQKENFEKVFFLSKISRQQKAWKITQHAVEMLLLELNKFFFVELFAFLK